MPSNNPELEKPDTAALPESGSEDEHQPTSNDDEDWRIDDAKPQVNDDDLDPSPSEDEGEHEPTSNDDDDDWRIDDAEPQVNDDDLDASPGEDRLTTEEKELDRRRRRSAPKSRANSGTSCQPDPGSATEKEQNTKDGGAARLDLHDCDRTDPAAPDDDDRATIGRPNDGVDQGTPEVDDGAHVDAAEKPNAQPKASSEKPKRRKNALKHGAFAQDIVLPGENPAEFQRLYQALIDEWKPDGETQMQAVRMLAVAIWTHRRAERFGRQELELAQELPEERELKLIKEVARMLANATSEKVVKWRISLLRENYRGFIDRQYPRANYQDFPTWLEALQTTALPTISEIHRTELLREWRNVAFQTARAEQVRANCDQLLTLSERADSRVHKAIKALIQLKTWQG